MAQRHPQQMPLVGTTPHDREKGRGVREFADLGNGHTESYILTNDFYSP